MTKAEFKALLDGLAAAWGRRDYAAAASVFADDVRDGNISHWREYQHIDDRAWEDYAGETVFN